MASKVGNDITIVDDDTLTLELIRRVLRNTDCDVRYFSDELEALSYLQHHRTRILIVDHRMPRLDGLELVERLVEAGGIAADRVYLCSAAEPPEHVCEKAKEYGAELLSKDIFRDKAQLLSLISNDLPQHDMVAGCKK